ncbi:MAG: hypothetical protein AAF719_00845, partial [Pseudomonadota bacterium]
MPRLRDDPESFMHDIRAIRADKETYRTGWNRRSEGSGDVVDEILALDEAVRAAVTEKQDAEQARNRDSKLIGQAKA